MSKIDEKRLWIIEARDGAWGANGICKGELVRCGECVRGYPDEEPQNDGKKYVWCKHWHAWKPEDGFCDVGDRKDGAE